MMESSLPDDTMTAALFKDLLKQMNSTDLFQTAPPCPILAYNSSTTPSSQNCSLEDGRLLKSIYGERLPIAPSVALSFFIYFTPVIFLIGIVGNILCLVVFLSKNMRKLSASIYLAALSTSDLMALIFYVLPEWLKYYLSSLPGRNTVIFLEQPGTCQVMLYLRYIARFLSSWIVVFFTIERFIGVCYPLKRRDICDPKSSSRVVVGAIVVASTACVFKPILSASHTAINGDPVCTSSREHLYLSFILDGIFGVTITFIPFVLITVLNLLIIRKLVIRNKRYRKIRIVTEESIIRLEFTFILLAISICFVSLNLPYFAVWCKLNWIYKEMFTTSDFSHSDNNRIDDLGEVLHVTRTIFFINYCINFFLYSITGAYFRKELKHMFLHKDRDHKNSHHCSAYFSRTNSRSTPQSWV